MNKLTFLLQKLARPSPVSQQNTPTSPGEREFWGEFVQSFNEPLDPTPILIGGTALVLLLAGIYGIYKVIQWQFGLTKKKRYNVFEALQRNLMLSSSQKQYLEALIERYKNQNAYEPEISTEYLREFLEFTIRNLTESPTQRLRRRVFEVSTVEEGHHVELMIKQNNEFETCSFEIAKQNDDLVSLRPSPGVEVELQAGDEVELSYRLEDSYLRGKARIEQSSEDEVTITIPDGLHSEELRSYRRMDTNSVPCKLSLRSEDGTQIVTSGTIEDISGEGAQVFTRSQRTNIRENMRGTLEFSLPGFSEMSLFAEVVRSEKITDEEQELGLHFTRVSMGDRERIFQFINRKDQTQLKTT